MPLFKTIQVNDFTKASIWCINESLADLKKGIALTENSQNRLASMKSEVHQKGFLSIRHLLKAEGYSDADIHYDEYGKPHVKDGNHISITHSGIFTGIILSSKAPVGIDIEKQRDKILRIAHKFTPIEEYKTIANTEALVRKLTIVWGGKESLYKIYGKKKLLFLHHIYIDDFSFHENQTFGEIRFEGEIDRYDIHFLEFEDYTCVFAYQ